jgi:hypothetical protein
MDAMHMELVGNVLLERLLLRTRGKSRTYMGKIVSNECETLVPISRTTYDETSGASSSESCTTIYTSLQRK